MSKRDAYLRTPGEEHWRSRRRLDQRARSSQKRDIQLQQLRSQQAGQGQRNPFPPQFIDHELAEIAFLWSSSDIEEHQWAWQRLSVLTSKMVAHLDPGIVERELVARVMQTKIVPTAVSDLMPRQDTFVARQICCNICDVWFDLIGLDESDHLHTSKLLNVAPLLIVHLSRGMGNRVAEACAYIIGELAMIGPEIRHKLCLNGALLPLARLLKQSVHQSAYEVRLLADSAAFALAWLCDDHCPEVKAVLGTKDFKRLLKHCLSEIVIERQPMWMRGLLDLMNHMAARQDSILSLVDVYEELLRLCTRPCSLGAQSQTAQHDRIHILRTAIQIIGNLAAKAMLHQSVIGNNCLWTSILGIVEQDCPLLMTEALWALHMVLSMPNGRRQRLVSFKEASLESDLRILQHRISVRDLPAQLKGDTANRVDSMLSLLSDVDHKDAAMVSAMPR